MQGKEEGDHHPGYGPFLVADSETKNTDKVRTDKFPPNDQVNKWMKQWLKGEKECREAYIQSPK